MGPISLVLIGLSLATVALTRNSRDRLVHAFAWCIAVTLAASIGVHRLRHGPEFRSVALMWLDCLGLYMAGTAAVGRWEWTPWLSGLIAATAAQCAAHVLCVLGLIGADQHTLALNILFLCQLASLLLGRTAQPQDDLRAPLFEEAIAPHGPAPRMPDYVSVPSS